MDEIENAHASPLNGHPVARLWLDRRHGLIARIAQALQARGTHPARAVVLVPYAQLMAEARRCWALARPQGFAPRFETTLNWAHSLGPEALGETDLRFDASHDLLNALELLERAGLQAQRQLLAAPLLEAAQQLGRCVAAVPPAERATWGQQARAALGPGAAGQAAAPVLAWEGAVARIALEWALASNYATDTLLAAPPPGVEQLIVLQGLQPDPLAERLLAQWGERGLALPLRAQAPAPQVQSEGPAPVSAPHLSHPPPSGPSSPSYPSGVASAADAPAMPLDPAALHLARHAARDAEDEAQRAAACVLRHLGAGRQPVALVATDRALTRRVRAMLAAQGVALRDENGWKLSTTRAAAALMGALRAGSWAASSDTVLDWLKHLPPEACAPAALDALERALRQAGTRDWRHWRDAAAPPDAARSALVAQVDGWREDLRRARPLTAWLLALRMLLQASGQWPSLRADPAGEQLLAALRLEEGARQGFEQALAGTGWVTRRLDLAEFTAWVASALESQHFRPASAPQAPVVVLPLSQLLGRAFAAVVLPGCDEQHLPAAPEPEGPWSHAQRQALGLPTREALQASARAAWQQALLAPWVDVLWRQSDAGGEALLPSPLVQLLPAGPEAADPRPLRALPARPLVPPQPRGQALPLQRLSASAYEDLRRCPYRFFALRQLGLRGEDELDAELGKRDFGDWLHRVLRRFHDDPRADTAEPRAEREARLDAAALAESQALAPEEFLPFQASWPRLRTHYLDWLAGHEATGARFAWAERDQAQPLGAVQLIGRIDRMDQVPDAADPGACQALLIDYKSEPLETTRQRVKHPLEDTQLAFYAALLPDDTLQAAYLSLGERECRSVPQPEVVAARDALVQGLLYDLARINEGAALPALGQGAVCEHCDARGLCRKDFWS